MLWLMRQINHINKAEWDQKGFRVMVRWVSSLLTETEEQRSKGKIGEKMVNWHHQQLPTQMEAAAVGACLGFSAIVWPSVKILLTEMSELSDRTSPEMRGIIRTHPVSYPALSAPTLERCHATLCPVRGTLPGPVGSDTFLTGSSLRDETGQPVFNSAPLPVQNHHLLELFCKDGTRMSYFTEDINHLHCSLGCFHLQNALKSIGSQFNLFECKVFTFDFLAVLDLCLSLWQVLMLIDGDEDSSLQQRLPALYSTTQQDGVTTAYICHNFTCSLPVTDPQELRRLLLDETSKRQAEWHQGHCKPHQSCLFWLSVCLNSTKN